MVGMHAARPFCPSPSTSPSTSPFECHWLSAPFDATSCAPIVVLVSTLWMESCWMGEVGEGWGMVVTRACCGVVLEDWVVVDYGPELLTPATGGVTADPRDTTPFTRNNTNRQQRGASPYFLYSQHFQSSICFLLHSKLIGAKTDDTWPHNEMLHVATS